MNAASVIKIGFLAFCLCFFHACAGPKKDAAPKAKKVSTPVSIESGEIPPDMAVEQFTVIGTLRNRKSYDKYLIKAFTNYTGKYMLADKNEIAARYNDISKYRYIMDYVEEMHGDIHVLRF